MSGTEDAYRDDKTCPYCGSLSPDAFMENVELGVEIGPTDKNYKAYLDEPNEHVGEPCIDGSANFAQVGDDWVRVSPDNIDTLPKLGPYGGTYGVRIGDHVHISKCPAMKPRKFYFQHLSLEQKKRFVELLNQKKVNIGYPGRFYVLPYFCVPSR